MSNTLCGKLLTIEMKSFDRTTEIISIEGFDHIVDHGKTRRMRELTRRRVKR